MLNKYTLHSANFSACQRHAAGRGLRTCPFITKLMNPFLEEKINPLIGSAVAAGVLLLLLGG